MYSIYGVGIYVRHRCRTSAALPVCRDGRCRELPAVFPAAAAESEVTSLWKASSCLLFSAVRPLAPRFCPLHLLPERPIASDRLMVSLSGVCIPTQWLSRRSRSPIPSWRWTVRCLCLTFTWSVLFCSLEWCDAMRVSVCVCDCDTHTLVCQRC
jgi:hypothetical protein